MLILWLRLTLGYCGRKCHLSRLVSNLTSNSTVTNVVPSSMTLALHAFGDQELLAEIKKRILNRPKVDYKLLEKDPLLLSMYAETLRFGVQIHIPRCSPHRPLTVGNSFIPRNKLILVDTWLAHTDESSWNTRDLRFPLENFWPQRFLVDPKDTQSGPVNPSNSHKHPISNKSKDIYYSTDGLEGAWIPYGGKFAYPRLQSTRLTVQKEVITLVLVEFSQNALC